jgi:hypothetical protein
MVLPPLTPKVFFSLFMMFLLCGCSSAGSNPLIPPESNETTPDIIYSSNPEFNMNNDPRFSGFTTGNERTAQMVNPPVLTYPVYSQPSYDMNLSGWFIDPENKLNPLTLTGKINDSYEFTEDIKYQVVVLPYGGHMYLWESPVLKQFEDYGSHFISMTILDVNGMGYSFPGRVTIGSTAPPELQFAVYPWVDITDSNKEKESDDSRILILLSNRVREEWEKIYLDLSNWHFQYDEKIKSLKLDHDNSSVEISLSEPLTQSTTLYFGPVEINGEIINSYIQIPAGGELELDEECECGDLYAASLDFHRWEETEKNEWCYEVHDFPECNIGIYNREIRIRDVIHRSYLDFWLDQDIATYDSMRYYYGLWDGFWPWEYYPEGDYIKTMHIRTDQYRQYYMELKEGQCPGFFVPLESEEFNSDLINPEFVEEPEIVTGPEAAEWLLSLIDTYGNNVRAHKGPFTDQAISAMQDDLCGLYVKIDFRDTGSHGSIGMLNLDVLDQFGNFEPPVGGGAALGGEVWIDEEEIYYNELQEWPDEDFDPLEIDGWFTGERLAIALEVTNLFENEAQAARVRITDGHNCWKRSGDMLNVPFDDYEVEDLIFLGDRYNYQNCDYIERRKSCDGPVAPRPAGYTSLNIYALVIASEFMPPDYIEAQVDAPLDEKNLHFQSIDLTLYKLTLPHTEHQWLDIFYEFDTLKLPTDCDVHIYTRGDNLEYRMETSPGEMEWVPFYAPIAHASDFEGPLDGPPGDSSTIPKIVVSSNDSYTDIAGQYTKDYSIAVCNQFNPNHPFGQGYIQIAVDLIDYLKYGSVVRSKYKPSSCPGAIDIYGCESGDSGAPIPTQENYKQNILTFGQEYVIASCMGESAQYGLQSEADVMFVLAHGNVQDQGARADQSFMSDFRNDPIEPYTSHTVDNAIWASDFADNPSLLGRDADWLVSLSCSLLKPPAYQDWQALCASGELKSVMGFIGLHTNQNPDDYWFYDRFMQYLQTSYSGDPGHWEDGIMSQDPAVISWMEAAYEYYNRAKTWLYGRKTDETVILRTAAVDNSGLWILETTQGAIKISEF